MWTLPLSLRGGVEKKWSGVEGRHWQLGGVQRATLEGRRCGMIAEASLMKASEQPLRLTKT